MRDLDNLGAGMTDDEVRAQLQRGWQRGKEVRILMDEAKHARTRLLEKIIAQNLDPQLIAESVTRTEKALKLGFDPAHTKWPPPVLSTYIEPHEMLGHASILIDEMFLDGSKITNWEHELSRTNMLLSQLCEKHGEPLLSKIKVTLEEFLKQMTRTLDRIEGSRSLGAKEFQKQTWYEYADYVLPARDEIEFALEGLQQGGLGDKFKEFLTRIGVFDERLRISLMDSSIKYYDASGKYDLTGKSLDYFPQQFWCRRLGLNRKGEPVWR